MECNLGSKKDNNGYITYSCVYRQGWRLVGKWL